MKSEFKKLADTIKEKKEQAFDFIEAMWYVPSASIKLVADFAANVK